MNENWQSLLRAAQDEIAAVDSKQHNVRFYRETRNRVRGRFMIPPKGGEPYAKIVEDPE